MRVLRKLSVVVLALVVIGAAWLWWNRHAKVDMASYVPADSLVYLEANDLPAILLGLTSTNAWRDITSESGLTTDFARYVRFSRLAALTGLGPSDQVILSRAQVAIVVTGFDATEGPNSVLKFTPRLALVAETHSSNWRAHGVMERVVSNFAQKSFGASSLSKKEVDGAEFLTWSNPNGTRREITAVAVDGVIIIGNDEPTVRTCLAVRRGERPSLAGNPNLSLMRERFAADTALTFGFAQTGSPAKIVEVLAPVFVADVSPDPKIQSVLASFLPQLVNKIAGDIGWSARVVDGYMEDDYFLTLPDGLADRLAPSFGADPPTQSESTAFLPRETQQFSIYSFNEPQLAWKGLNATLSSQVGVVHATSISRGLDALLTPYGVESPREFLQAAGREIITARLDSDSETKVLIVAARDRAALAVQVSATLGPFNAEDFEGQRLMFAGTEDKTASFAGDFLIMGGDSDVRRCLSAWIGKQNIKDAGLLNTARVMDDSAFVTTWTLNEDDAARLIVAAVGGRNRRIEVQNPQIIAKGPSTAYTVSQTRLTTDGIAKRTRSAFGLLGDAIVRFGNPQPDRGVTAVR